MMTFDLMFVLQALQRGFEINEWFHWKYFVTFSFAVFGASLVVRFVHHMFLPWLLGHPISMDGFGGAADNLTISTPRVPRLNAANQRGLESGIIEGEYSIESQSRVSVNA